MQLDPKALAKTIKDSSLSFKEMGGSFVFTCCRCNKKDKLYIRKSDGRFICFYCADRNSFLGKAEFALAELLSRPLSEVRSQLYGSGEIPIGFDLPEIRAYGEEIEPAEETVYEPLVWPWDFYPLDHLFAKKGVQYLEQRGIPKDIAMEYDLRYCPKFRRVYFPVKNNGLLYGWQGRIVVNEGFLDNSKGKMIRPCKILSSKAIPRNFCMFSDRLVQQNHAILCEGPVDAMKAHLCGGNVATMGKVVSLKQIKRIVDAGIKKIYLALDPDAAQESTHILRNVPGVEFYNMFAPAPYKDIGEMTMEEVYKLYLNAEPMNPNKIYIYIKPHGV